jgi:hypothetical protein
MGKVFLGGTCNNSTWRERLIDMLDPAVQYFNPVVEDWTEECRLNEIKERELARVLVYVITPCMTGVYSIAEVVNDSIKRPEKTILCVLETDVNKDGDIKTFDDGALRSLHAVKEMVKSDGAKVFNSLEGIAMYLNQLYK